MNCDQWLLCLARLDVIISRSLSSVMPLPTLVDSLGCGCCNSAVCNSRRLALHCFPPHADPWTQSTHPNSQPHFLPVLNQNWRLKSVILLLNTSCGFLLHSKENSKCAKFLNSCIVLSFGLILPLLLCLGHTDFPASSRTHQAHSLSLRAFALGGLLPGVLFPPHCTQFPPFIHGGICSKSILPGRPSSSIPSWCPIPQAGCV